jgi:hypothetical protein
MTLRGEDAIVVMTAVISALDGIMPDGAMRDFADIFGVFADAVLDGMADFTQRIAVMLVLSQNGWGGEHSRPQDEYRGQAALNNVQFHGTLFLVSSSFCHRLENSRGIVDPIVKTVDRAFLRCASFSDPSVVDAPLKAKIEVAKIEVRAIRHPVVETGPDCRFSMTGGGRSVARLGFGFQPDLKDSRGAVLKVRLSCRILGGRCVIPSWRGHA